MPITSSSFKPKKPKPKGEYRNLEEVNGIWSFEVKLKDGNWKQITGIQASEEYAKLMAQSTADSWRNR